MEFRLEDYDQDNDPPDMPPVLVVLIALAAVAGAVCVALAIGA